MKLKYLIWSICALFLTACFEDEGNYKYKEVDGIEVEGMAERYVVLSFIDQLNIPITVNTSYKDLSYEWYIYDPEVEHEFYHDENYEAELISTEKDLNCEVGWQPGNYTVMVKVTANENGYAVYKKTDVEVVTRTSRGFYVLKETPDGNTDLDLLYDDNEPVAADLLSTAFDAPMTGKPLMLGIVYSEGYINDEGDIEGCNALSVSTEEGEMALYNSHTMAKIHDNNDIRFGGIADDEKPIVAFNYCYGNFLLTSHSVAGAYVFAMMPQSTGAFGTTSGTGASRYFMIDGSLALYYWNERDQRIDYADQYSFGHSFFGDYDEMGYSTTGLHCVACGSSYASASSGTINFFLLEDDGGQRYMYYVSDASAYYAAYTERCVEVPASSKFARATHFATNARTAIYTYFVCDNQLYIYNLGTVTEQETPVTLPGISSDETITYLSYQYMSSWGADPDYDFTHLVVGTQTGNTYRVYMYDIVGGVPRDLVRTFSGEGILKQVAYVSPNFDVYSGIVSVPD